MISSSCTTTRSTFVRWISRTRSGRSLAVSSISTCASAGGAESSYWSEKGDSIYFNTGKRATAQFFAVSTQTGEAKQLTDVQGSISVARDEDTGRFLITYQDPKTPAATYTVSSLADIGNRAKWVQLTDPNAWARQQLALG